MNGPRLLALWMHDNRKTVVALGQMLNCTPSHVSHLRLGRRSPGLGRAIALERLTGIPVSAWESPQGDERSNAPEAAA